MIRDLRLCAAAFVAGLLVAAAICVWMQYRPSLPSVLAPPSKEVKGEKPLERECEKTIVYRDRVKKELGLPDTVKRDPDKQVTASTQVPGSEHPHTVTSVFDFDTGQTDLYVRRDPLPWLAFNRRGALGLAYGIKDDTDGFVTRGYGRLDLMQVKRLHLGLLGDVDSVGDWYGGGFVEYRW